MGRASQLALSEVEWVGADSVNFQSGVHVAARKLRAARRTNGVCFVGRCVQLALSEVERVRVISGRARTPVRAVLHDSPSAPRGLVALPIRVC